MLVVNLLESREQDIISLAIDEVSQTNETERTVLLIFTLTIGEERCVDHVRDGRPPIVFPKECGEIIHHFLRNRDHPVGMLINRTKQSNLPGIGRTITELLPQRHQRQMLGHHIWYAHLLANQHGGIPSPFGAMGMQDIRTTISFLVFLEHLSDDLHPTTHIGTDHQRKTAHIRLIDGNALHLREMMVIQSFGLFFTDNCTLLIIRTSCPKVRSAFDCSKQNSPP